MWGDDMVKFRVFLDFIVLVAIICILCISIAEGEPVYFTLAIFGCCYMAYELHKDLRNASR